MRKKLSLTLAVLMVLFIAATGCNNATAPSSTGSDTASPVESGTEAPTTEDSTVKLNYGSNMPPVALLALADMDIFLPKVAELTNNTLEIEPFWAETLVASDSAYTECLAGLADMVALAPGREVEHFVIENSIGYFFYGVTDVADSIPMIREVFEECDAWQNEYTGGEMIGFGSTGGVWLHLTKPIESLADLKGMTIRVSEQFVYDILEKLGAVPVYTTLSETADQMSKGIIDGIAQTYESLRGLGVAELTTYSVDLGFIAPGNGQKFISDAAIAKLSDNQFAALKQACLDLEAETPAYMDANDEDVRQWMAENYSDHIIGALSAEDQAFVETTLKTLAQEKVEALNAAGYDGDGIFQLVRSKID